MRLNISSMTTSSSVPRISVTLPAIHLFVSACQQHVTVQGSSKSGLDILLHDLQIDLGHVNLLVEFGRELCGLEQPCIYAGRHICECWDCAPNLGAWLWEAITSKLKLMGFER